MGWRTIQKYLQRPDQPTVSRVKTSKLDPFKAAIADLLAQDPTVSSAVIQQRLRAIGYGGGHSILREYVRQVRPKPTPRAFVRMEPIAGERCEVDWGHFGALDYSGDKRKLYAFAPVSSI
jgi:transposase